MDISPITSPASGVREQRPAGILPPGTTSSLSSSSFAQQIESALEGYFGSAGNASALTINIQPVTGQNSGSGQFLVTVTPSAADISSAPVSLEPVTPPSPTPTPAGGTGDNGGAAQTPPPDAPPSGYQNVPFGSGYTTVPTLATELARQNAMMAMMSPAAILNQDKISAAGDPMAGKSIDGTTLNWDDLTQDQQLAYIYAMNYGLPQGQTMQTYLDSNLGPKVMANAPSTNPTLFGNA